LATESLTWVDQRDRVHPETEHPYRGPFQRDRDRILHSSAYRRLSGKMQVFTGEMGDYHRTRLTHTQEVATVARTIGRALGLNEDLIEALALMHDIGHPPYGHAGEDALNECAVDCGGFSHNQFALTIATELEFRYNEFSGMNLTHDDDAIKLGLVTLEEMESLEIVRESIAHVRQHYTSLNEELMRKAVVHRLIERQVTSLITNCGNQFQARNFSNFQDAVDSDFVLGHSPELDQQKQELERFLYARVYRHPKLVTVRQQAQERLKEMFSRYCEAPELFPKKYQERAEKIGVPRMAIEYIAGMTDRFCEDVHREIVSKS